MKIRQISQFFNLRDIRNAILVLVAVFGGIGLAILTLYAHEANRPQLAGIAAGISLVFVLLILIFVVPPLARNASREASQMNLPFEFTSGGAVMLVLMVVVGFSAWNTGNNLLFLVLSFLAATMIVGFFAGRISLKKLDVKMRFPETIFAGEKTSILLNITNRKRIFPSFSVVAEVRGRERERSVAADDIEAVLPKFLAMRLTRPPTVRRTLDHIAYIERNSSIESRSEHVFAHRGRFLIKDFELSTRFPFGFFRHRRRLPARETDLIVFPEPQHFDDISTETPLDAGKLVANKRGIGQDLLALRDYQPNDDLRRIDWKATARSRHLTVREFAAEDDLRVTVILDASIPLDKNEHRSLRERIATEQSGKGVVISGRFEAGVKQAAAILTHFADRHGEIRLMIGENDTGFGSTRSHLYDILKQLAMVEPKFTPDQTSREPEALVERISNDPDDSHRYLVTANDIGDESADRSKKLKLIRF